MKGAASMKRLVIWWVIAQIVLSSITVSSAAAGSIAGTWNINCNNFTGRMEIREDSGGYSGRLFLQGKWEKMLDLVVKGDKINFRRATANQRYGGIISGTTINGFFNQDMKGKYPWKAHLRGAS
jgi:hypothetical protein